MNFEGESGMVNPFYQYIGNVFVCGTSGRTMKENPMKYCRQKAATFKR